MATTTTQRTCPLGHTYFKSTSCPTCPTCERSRQPEAAFLAKIGAPARRALEREGIVTLEVLAAQNPKALLKLHGVGPSAIPRLQAALNEGGLEFANP